MAIFYFIFFAIRCFGAHRDEPNYVWDQSFIVSKLYLLQYSRLLLHVWSDGSFTNETRAQSASSLHVDNLWRWEVCADIFRSDSSIDFPFQTNESICFSFFSIFSFFFFESAFQRFARAQRPSASRVTLVSLWVTNSIYYISNYNIYLDKQKKTTNKQKKQTKTN